MSRIGRGRYENDNRESLGTTAEIMHPVVTADIKTNSGNVCEYWDASCHVQQGVDSIVENVVQAGENITTWGDEVTVTIQESYVENIETPIVETVENVQDAIDKAKKDNETYWEIQNANYDKWVKDTQQGIDDAAKNVQDAYNATVKAAEDAAADAAQNAQDAFDATAKAAADAAAAAGDAATSGINNTLKYGALAALGIVGVLLVSKK